MALTAIDADAVTDLLSLPTVVAHIMITARSFVHGMPRSSVLLTLAVSCHLLALVYVPVSQCARTTTKARGDSVGVDTVRGLIARLLPEHSERFVLEEIALGDASYGVFEIDSHLRGTSSLNTYFVTAGGCLSRYSPNGRKKYNNVRIEML